MVFLLMRFIVYSSATPDVNRIIQLADIDFINYQSNAIRGEDR